MTEDRGLYNVPMVIAILLLLAQAPQSAPAQPAAPKPAPAAASPLNSLFPQEAAPADGVLGVPIYPNAVFLTSYDAGRGQRYYLYGATGSVVELVAYYRTLLKNKGTQLFDQPLTHIFEVGRYNESHDGVSAKRDDQGLRVGQCHRILEPAAGRTARAVPDGHSDRACTALD